MVVPAAMVSDAADSARNSVAVGRGTGVAVDGARSFSKRVTISRMFLRLTCEIRQYLLALAHYFTDHATCQFERPHAYTHILVIETR